MATRTSGIDDLIDSLAADGRLVHVDVIPPRDAAYAQLARPVPGSISHCLPPNGLWSHQAEAINLIRDRSSVVVATGTGSGKSLCYQLPIAESIVSGLRPSTALALYPTKALAHDQARGFDDLGVPGLTLATYDGDASRQERIWARDHANVVLTNPEMLHYGLLPNHRRWAPFLKRLDHVVVDELHTLRGVFGTHVGHLLRRLARLASRYGSEPTFVFCSATVGDPGALATHLCGKPTRVVNIDGSPNGLRRIALVQPTPIDRGQHLSRSPVTETIRSVAQLVDSGRRVIAFCASRAQTERVALGVARAVRPELSDTIRPYRSGYLAAERREIEAELASGALNAVITTSALELGVDIDGLDDTVLCGFPGSVASMWQQIGRSGRSRRESLSVVVTGEDQLDQWFVNHPTELFTRPPEPVVVNMSNPSIREPHLGCAARENPLSARDERWWPDLDEGVRQGVLADDLGLRLDHFRMPRAVWAGDGVPTSKINLRSASLGQVRIIDQDSHLIGTVESERASTIVHPGAIYVHRGQAWRVTELDLRHRQARVIPNEGNIWTTARTQVGLEVLEPVAERWVGRAKLGRGSVRVTTQVVGYQEFCLGEAGSRAQHTLDLPPLSLDTTAVWYEWPDEVVAGSGIGATQLAGALHALEHAAIGILPLFAICDRWDVGGVSYTRAPTTGRATAYIYDGYPGGAGVAELAFEAADRHLAATAEVIEGCDCDRGCPSCVQSPKCGNGNEPLDKWAALALLTNTLEAQPEPF